MKDESTMCRTNRPMRWKAVWHVLGEWYSGCVITWASSPPRPGTDLQKENTISKEHQKNNPYHQRTYIYLYIYNKYIYICCIHVYYVKMIQKVAISVNECPKLTWHFSKNRGKEMVRLQCCIPCRNSPRVRDLLYHLGTP